MPGPVNRGMIYLHEDPDRAWAELGEHILWEAVTYGGWSTDQRSLMHLPGVQTIDEVKASGRYRFLTPDQLIAEIRDSRTTARSCCTHWSVACRSTRRGNRSSCWPTRCCRRCADCMCSMRAAAGNRIRLVIRTSSELWGIHMKIVSNKILGLAVGAGGLIAATGLGVQPGDFATDVQAAPDAPVYSSPPPPSPPPPPPPPMTQAPDDDYWTGQGSAGGAPGAPAGAGGGG